MELKETFRQIFEAVGTTQAESSVIVGRSPKLLNDRLVRDTLRYTEFLELINGIGVKLTYVVKATGEEFDPEGEPLKALVEHAGSTMQKAGKIIGKPPQKFKERIEKGIFRASEFIKICNALGYDLKYTIISSGNVIALKPRGHGRRVCAMVGGIKYNTTQSRAISNSFYADGVNEYSEGRASELYQDNAGRYFLVDYFDIEGVKDRIIPITAESAQAFIDNHGYIE